MLFYERYAEQISHWCRRWGATAEDAEDVVQETLLVVFRKIAEFQYNRDQSFRAWLKTVSYHIWLQVFKHKRKTMLDSRSKSLATAYNHKLNAAVREFGGFLDQIAELEILNLALSNVRKRVPQRIWLCFELSELEEMPRKEIAEQLGISTGYVQVNVFRVRQLIDREIAALDPQ